MISLVDGWLKKLRWKEFTTGGVSLNVKLNQKIWYKFKERVNEHYCFPIPGDSGSVLCRLYGYYNNKTFNHGLLKHLYLGPSYSDDYIEKCLNIRKVKFKKLANPENVASEYLSENKIIAWFQGNMESGPRALGIDLF